MTKHKRQAMTKHRGVSEPTTLLVDEREAARLLDVSARTVWALRDRGELLPVRIPGTRLVRYSVDTLRDWIGRQQQGGDSR